MTVLLVTTWNIPCGIAEHSAMLVEYTTGEDLGFEIEPELHPDAVFARIDKGQKPDVLCLNYHAALHSQWHPRHIAMIRVHCPVVVIYHDTYQTNGEQAHGLYDVADAFIVHEPVDDLPKAIYWRQGIPDTSDWRWRQPQPPLVGSAGFPFAWKNFDLLCDAAALVGWRVRLFAPGATPDQCERWERCDPRVVVCTDFLERYQLIGALRECDATAFLHYCHNSGTSGAIRLGIAARKPVLALAGCRQMRDLEHDELGARAIHWITDGRPEGVAAALAEINGVAFDGRVTALAERDSWRRLGQHYRELFTSLHQGRATLAFINQEAQG